MTVFAQAPFRTLRRAVTRMPLETQHGGALYNNIRFLNATRPTDMKLSFATQSIATGGRNFPPPTRTTALTANRERCSTPPPSRTTTTNFSSLASSTLDDDTELSHDGVKTVTSPKKAVRRRGTLEEKNPIVLTERAAQRIQELLQGAQEKNDAATIMGLRLGVKRRGCNGLSYTLNYATPESVGKDILMESHNIKVYIEPMALFSVVGTVMDWEESEMSSEFTFQNPNSKGECGCGESFSV